MSFWRCRRVLSFFQQAAAEPLLEAINGIGSRAFQIGQEAKLLVGLEVVAMPAHSESSVRDVWPAGSISRRRPRSEACGPFVASVNSPLIRARSRSGLPPRPR
jgi:hypothetical protein